jgi:hypothetical protein
LQRVGAIQLHGSAYVLPESAETREDLEWVAAEIVSGGGSATIFTAVTADPRSRDPIVAAFRSARAEDYDAIRAAAAALAKSVETATPARGRRRAEGAARRARGASTAAEAERARSVARLRERFAAVTAIDFFAADGRDQADAAIAALESREEDRMTRSSQDATGAPRLAARDFKNRVWVTRPRPGIDRMSTAWLVRRFIDPEATFRFVDADRRAELAEGAVPFDMYGVELGHQAGGCTFETVKRRFGIEDAAVDRLARIVHQLDLKTDEAPAPEAEVVGRLVAGLRQMYADDGELLERGIGMFEALYRADSGGRAAPSPPKSRSRRR